MSTVPAALIDVPTALAAFDSARDAFLAAFAQAPDEALGYVPQGDEYALGVLEDLIGIQDGFGHDCSFRKNGSTRAASFPFGIRSAAGA